MTTGEDSRVKVVCLGSKEGLKVREAEMEKLRDALRQVEEARERRKRRVKEVFDEDLG